MMKKVNFDKKRFEKMQNLGKSFRIDINKKQRECCKKKNKDMYALTETKNQFKDYIWDHATEFEQIKKNIK